MLAGDDEVIVPAAGKIREHAVIRTAGWQLAVSVLLRQLLKNIERRTLIHALATGKQKIGMPVCVHVIVKDALEYALF